MEQRELSCSAMEGHVYCWKVLKGVASQSFQVFERSGTSTYQKNQITVPKTIRKRIIDQFGENVLATTLARNIFWEQSEDEDGSIA